MRCSHFVCFATVALVACGKKADDSGVPTGSGSSTEECDTQLVGNELPASLYSVWGTSASDVWMVGQDVGSGPLVLHYDGSVWSQVDTGTSGALWWVWGDGADSVWFSGRDGRVVHHVPSAGTFDEVEATDPLFTLYGIWGSSGSDIWTVGGAADNSGVGVVAHYDGTDWTTRTDVPQPGVVFKVWGSSASDVHMVGPGALILKTDGTDWTTVANPFAGGSAPDLFTVAGCGDEVYATGGFGNAAVARTADGATWTDDSPEPLALAPRFTGVATSCDHGTVAAGDSGGIWRRDDEWTALCDIPVTVLDFHGTWIDPDGGIWAVGGDLTAGTQGVAAYHGPAAVPNISL